MSVSSDVPAHFVGDPLRVSQVIGYLLDNAIKYTERGKVTLLCDLAEYAESSVVLRVRVEDTGHGMPEEQATTLRQRLAEENPPLPEKGVRGLGLVGGLPAPTPLDPFAHEGRVYRRPLCRCCLPFPRVSPCWNVGKPYETGGNFPRGRLREGSSL